MRLINSYKIKQYLIHPFKMLSSLFSETVCTCILKYIYIRTHTHTHTQTHTHIYILERNLFIMQENVLNVMN